MVRYFIYAKDFSGSTGGEEFYHENGLKTVQQFKSDIEKIQNELSQSEKPSEESRIIYLHWDDRCTEESEKSVIDAYEAKMGNGSTAPDTIIEWIQSHIGGAGDDIKIELLYIITDGMIDYGSIDRCMELNRDMHYGRVVFHAFNLRLDSIDLSVAASFLKSQCTIYRNYEFFGDTDISEAFDYEKIKIENFAAEKDNLISYINLKYINKLGHNCHALEEIDNLKRLRNRLFSELTSKSEKSEGNLDTKDRNVFLREFVSTEWYQNLNENMKVEIDQFISTLINYITSEKKSYSFDALKFNKTFSNPVEEEPIVDVDFTADQEIEFPDIILDDDKGIPVIILTELNLLDKIIFHRTKEPSAEVSPASFSKFKSTMECPLFLLNDPDISESIGYFYTLNVYKQLLEKTTRTEPRTRRPFHGGLVLTDTEQFDKYNDYILSATYFDSKKVNYNVGLFYFVLLKNCENKEWMDKNVVEQFKKYVMRRISVTKCKIGLSSLPLDPQINTLLPTALWYCVELSSIIFKDDPLNCMHERLRMFYGVAHCMIEILKYFNYDLDFKSIHKRRDLIRHVMILKKIPTRQEKIYYILEKIFKSVNGFLVCEIEKPYNLNKLSYLKLDHKGMLSEDANGDTVHLNDYVHIMHFVDDLDNSEMRKIKICDKTFRPFFAIDQKNSFYTELVNITKKVVINNDDDKDKIKITYEPIDSLDFSKILSYFNLFINCTAHSKKYPTLPEYTEYISKKKKFNDELVTIFPSNIYSAAEVVYGLYDDVMQQVDATKFLEVCKKYFNRFDRIKAEEVLQFNEDSQINEFISNEETKVNIIKTEPAKIIKTEPAKRNVKVPLTGPQNTPKRKRLVRKRFRRH